jgi:peptide deformylase
MEEYFSLLTDNISVLREKSEEVSIERGKETAKILVDILMKVPYFTSISAIQIGRHERVCVVYANKRYLTLINPEIVDSKGEMVFEENCISFLNEVFPVKRAVQVKVKCSNLPGVLTFGPNIENFNVNDVNKKQTPDIFESFAVQQAIDFMNGILFYDRQYKLQPRTVTKEHNRNDKVRILNRVTGEEKEIKYKEYDTNKYCTSDWTLL